MDYYYKVHMSKGKAQTEKMLYTKIDICFAKEISKLNKDMYVCLLFNKTISKNVLLILLIYAILRL